MLYELFYLVGVSKEAELPKIKPEIQKIITGEGGVFEEKEVVEKRKLAYKVGRETHGFYVAHRFNLEETEKFSAINKKLGLYPGILRFIISRTEDLPELTTREERKEKEAAKIKFIPKKKEIESPATKTETKVREEKAAPAEPVETEKETPKTEVSQDDIDKKLEELLNI
jgi:ribosomal protein S6